MATDFTQDSVLRYLKSRGGSVKNSELLAHFKPFLRDHDDRLRHREHFKKFVNCVATVKQEEGVSYVVLRKKFRDPDSLNPCSKGFTAKIPDGRKASDPGSSLGSGGSPADRAPGKVQRPHASAIPPRDSPRFTPLSAGELVQGAHPNILPAAGIILNNTDAESNFNLVKKPLPSLTPDVPQLAVSRPLPAHVREEPVPRQTQVGAPPGITAPALPLLRPVTCPTKRVDPRVENHQASAGVQSFVEAPLRHDVDEYHLQEQPAPILPQHQGLHHGTGLQVKGRGARYRKSYKSAVSQDNDDEEEEDQTVVVPRRPDSAGGAVPMIQPQNNRKTILSSLPPSHTPPSLTPSLPFSKPPTPASLPSSPPLSLSPSVPISQAPTPTPVRPSLPSSLSPSLPPSLPYYLPQTLTPSVPISQAPTPTPVSPSLPSSLPPSLPPSLPYYLPQSLTPSVPTSQSPTPASFTPSLPSSPPPPFPFPLTPSLPSSQPPSIPSLSPPTISPFLSASPQSQTPRKLSGTPGARPASIPTIHIQNLGEPAPDLGSSPGSSPLLKRTPGEPCSAAGGTPKRSPGCSRRGPGWALGPGLSSSHDSLLLLPSSASSCSDWLSPLTSSTPPGAEWNGSDQMMGSHSGDAGLRVANDNSLLSLMHRSEQKTTTPWHHSTGHLLEDGDQGSPLYGSTGNLLDSHEKRQSSDRSASPVFLRKKSAVARRLSSRLTRKCQSLGAGLDLPFPGEEEDMQGGGGSGGGAAARRNRLTLLSSSLSLRYNLSTSSLSSTGSTPPRCPSVGDLAEGREHNSSYTHRQVPLEPGEHAWLVKGAAGSWTNIYALFRDDPSLLHKPDFISGFTVLHWIAKHGDHRVLNTLWYGVSKAGLTFDVNARAWNGYTPLHLAALHGHKKMARLLVQKFHADVRARDTAGKRAWQYLEPPHPTDLLHLLGAPRRPGARGAPLQHHASCSAADGPQRRPRTVGSAAGVKRSTSIAAFLKHKTLLRFRDLSDVGI